jgi:hypothetical protein
LEDFSNPKELYFDERSQYSYEETSMSSINERIYNAVITLESLEMKVLGDKVDMRYLQGL